MTISWFSDSRLFRRAACGAVLTGMAAFTAHREGHTKGLGVQQPEPVAWQHPDDSPERHPDAGRPAPLLFTNVVSGITSQTVTIASLGLEGWQSPRDPFTFVTLSAQVSGQGLVLQGPPCRVCGLPIESWDDGRTRYCANCLTAYPETAGGSWFS